MTTIAEDIQNLNDSARKLFGHDVSILVARAPAFGNDDTCILVMGKRHAEAALGFARIKAAQISTERGRDFLTDTEYTFSRIVITA